MKDNYKDIISLLNTIEEDYKKGVISEKDLRIFYRDIDLLSRELYTKSCPNDIIDILYLTLIRCVKI